MHNNLKCEHQNPYKSINMHTSANYFILSRSLLKALFINV